MAATDEGIDVSRIEAANHARAKIAHITAGCRTDPCVVVAPGGGALKEINLLWMSDLANYGLFVVAYDLRGTGGSQPGCWAPIFAAAGTNPTAEMDRVSGKTTRPSSSSRQESIGRVKQRLNPSIVENVGDFDSYVVDAIALLDELQIEKAHVMGLSQGGFIAQLIAMQYPDRVISCISCGTVCDAGYAGMAMAAGTAAGEAFAASMKQLSLDFGLIEAATTSGGPGSETTREVPDVRPHLFSRDRYIAYRRRGLEICVPGFAAELYRDVAAKEYDSGVMTDDDCNTVALKYEVWERLGKRAAHQQRLRDNGGSQNRNKVPILYVHGKKDGVIHVGQAQQLFAMTANSVLELHEYGHNFGPPLHQRKLLGRVADFMKKALVAVSPPPKTTEAASGDTNNATVHELSIGKDTYSSEVSADLLTRLASSSVSEVYDAFCSGVQTTADTEAVFERLLKQLGLEHLRGAGLRLFVESKAALEASKPSLNFKQKKLLSDLDAKVKKASATVARLRRGSSFSSSSATAQQGPDIRQLLAETEKRSFNRVLVCGAGPVGLRAACELALLGFQVRVIEKRPNFSRANILTFWDETMNDMLSLGAKSFFPHLSLSGSNKFLGTRQIQVCLLKTLLLLGGDVRYGFEIYSLSPPSLSSSPAKWAANFRPYVKHQRRDATDADAAAKAATEFQQAKTYDGHDAKMTLASTNEIWEVDEAFINGSSSTTAGGHEATNMSLLPPEFFDAYVIAEGSWSDSTAKLGFNKRVEPFKSSFGLVINMKYNPEDFKEKQMKTCIHFCLSQEWPLRACPIQAEFVEYLKGETHFFALVVSKRNVVKDDTEKRIAEMTPEARAALTDDIIALMRRSSQQKGLVEMGVFRKEFASGKACLAPGNVDADRLFEMARAITAEMGLPMHAEMYETNPVQLFDFSRRAHCMEPVRILRSPIDDPDGVKPHVLGPDEYIGSPTEQMTLSTAGVKTTNKVNSVEALVLPVGDALQEPNWTQGLGINRGFHTAMNQAYALLVAREKSLSDGIRESRSVYEAVLKMKWGQGHSGLAGSGSGNIGLKPFREWTSDPRTRLPYK